MSGDKDRFEEAMAEAQCFGANDVHIVALCDRIMIARREVGLVSVQEGAASGAERKGLMERRMTLYDRIDLDMMKLGDLSPTGLYAIKRMIEVVADVILAEVADPQGWLGGGRTERIVVMAVESLAYQADKECRLRLIANLGGVVEPAVEARPN